jgi:aspartyl/asparaginyl-tRNA synthetase
VILFAACDRITAVPINKLVENPRDYDGKVVTIEGKVTEIFSLIAIKYFVIRDNTGEIVVVTDRILPKEGSSISVKGHVQEAFSIGNNQLIVLIEDNNKT